MVVRHLKYTCDIDGIVTSLNMKVIPTQCINKGNKYVHPVIVLHLYLSSQIRLTYIDVSDSSNVCTLSLSPCFYVESAIHVLF